jgi:PhzF family phenazine biosynthesis protein
VDRPYKVVDVFTDRPLRGNPVGVVFDADGLDAPAMQRIANWTNLSETTFVLSPTRPDADYRLRIFTPVDELPFAGHPTLGSAHAIVEAGRVQPREGLVVQECGVGLVPVRLDAASRTLELPPARIADLPAGAIIELESVLGTQVVRSALPATVDVGPVWIVAQVAGAEALLALVPDYPRSAALERRLGATGVTVFGDCASGAESQIEVRSFAPSSGVAEDPVCGSGNGAVAAFRRARGLLPPADASYRATQGRCVGRDGRISLTASLGGIVTVGGACVTVLDGRLRL